MIEKAQLLKICPRVTDPDSLVVGLNAAMLEFDINTPEREAMFLAQCTHESGCFRHVVELWGPDQVPEQRRYDFRQDLGNTKPLAIDIAARHGKKPGFFWRGRGYLQITGYNNYVEAATTLGIDCVERPELLERPENAARVSALWWSRRKANTIADGADQAAARRVSRLVNRGNPNSMSPANHEEERLALWRAFSEALA
jgi:putative chitinase